jgi:glycine C-acetyltransferase
MPTAGSSRRCSRPEDAILSDELNHASIIDGVRLCKAKRLRYKNNDMADLEEKLKEAASARIRLIATDGVFSMDGFVANLRGICDLAESTTRWSWWIDSHAVGFMGENGRGTPEYAGVMGRVDILTGTFGKAMGGASGGYTAASGAIVALLRQKSRPFSLFNTLAPACGAATLKVCWTCRRSDGARRRLTEIPPGSAARSRPGALTCRRAPIPSCR